MSGEGFEFVSHWVCPDCGLHKQQYTAPVRHRWRGQPNNPWCNTPMQDVQFVRVDQVVAALRNLADEQPNGLMPATGFALQLESFAANLKQPTGD